MPQTPKLKDIDLSKDVDNTLQNSKIHDENSIEEPKTGFEGTMEKVLKKYKQDE